MHKILVLAAAGSVLLGVTGSNAAELLSPPAAPAATTAAATTSAPPSGVSQVPAKGPPILLEAGKGTLIRLPRPAATVFIANPDVADVQVKSPAMIYVNAKTPGETVLYAVDADDNVLLNAPIRVEHDVSRLRESLHALIPGENVAVESVDGPLVLKGNVSSASRAERANALATSIANEAKGKVVNQLSVATPNQVNLRVKIAEVNRTVLKALGVNWLKDVGRTTFVTNNPVTGGQIAATNTILFGFGAAGSLIQQRVDALAQEGLITILAEPNLTATSGQPASFLAGGEFPVPVVTGVTGQVTIVFKEFGIRLNFTPTIAGDAIRLKVRPEVSTLDFANGITLTGFRIPALTTRRAETVVELKDGQSFAIAGLLDNLSQLDAAAIPVMGHLPIIGPLFRSQSKRAEQTELMVLITPRLVRALDPDEVPPLPTSSEPFIKKDGDEHKGDISQHLAGHAGVVDAPEQSARPSGQK
jgi:pilus assembly protein CpaC